MCLWVWLGACIQVREGFAASFCRIFFCLAKMKFVNKLKPWENLNSVKQLFYLSPLHPVTSALYFQNWKKSKSNMNIKWSKSKGLRILKPFSVQSFWLIFVVPEPLFFVSHLLNSCNISVRPDTVESTTVLVLRLCRIMNHPPLRFQKGWQGRDFQSPLSFHSRNEYVT